MDSCQPSNYGPYWPSQSLLQEEVLLKSDFLLHILKFMDNPVSTQLVCRVWKNVTAQAQMLKFTINNPEAPFPLRHLFMQSCAPGLHSPWIPRHQDWLELNGNPMLVCTNHLITFRPNNINHHQLANPSDAFPFISNPPHLMESAIF